MTALVHSANSRGRAQHGWLHTHHSFSFARYYNPQRMGFGKLRVLNDDVIGPGAGFGAHSHENMEIVSISLSGALRHRDNMGHTHVVQAGDVQAMSAGTGITHAEYNDSHHEPVNLLQIWVIPKTMNIDPRYDQRRIDPASLQDTLRCIVAPMQEQARHADAVAINQDAWFFRGRLRRGHGHRYDLQTTGNGIYLFVIEGSVGVDDALLRRRDAIAIEARSQIDILAAEDSDILVIEVPLH